MARLPLYLNIFMAALTLIAAIYTITLKSQIAVDQRSIARLNSQIQAEEEMSVLLRAEWARLQRRDSIEALGVARFGAAVGDTAQEINAKDLPQRRNAAQGRAQALVLFGRSVAGQLPTEIATPDTRFKTLDPSNHTLNDPDPIAICLQGGPCPWHQEQTTE